MIKKRGPIIGSFEVFYFLYGGLGNSILAYPTLYVLSQNFKTKVFLLNKIQEDFILISNLRVQTDLSSSFFEILRKLKNKKIYASTHNLYAPYKKHPLIYFFLKSKIRIGLKGKNYLRVYTHTVPFFKKEKEGNVELIKPIIKEIKEFNPASHSKDGGFLLFFPGSSKKFKNFKRWKYFTDLGERLKNKFNILAVLGPDEIELKEIFEEKKINVFVFQNLKDLFKVFENSLFYIGNDTGLTHLASWFGLKGIVIYTSTDPEKNETLNSSTKITPSLFCFPCYKFFKTRCINREKYKCTYIIKTEEVLKALEETLNF
ncbi:MAG: glycosyltransferase family 9 protein [Candidatus Hydrothermales bacterium]